MKNINKDKYIEIPFISLEIFLLRKYFFNTCVKTQEYIQWYVFHLNWDYLSKTVSDGFQTWNESNPWRYFHSSKFEREPLPPVSSFAVDYWFIILIQEGTSRGAWTGIWRCNTRGSLRVKVRGVIPCRSLLFIEWFIEWILIHGNKSEIYTWGSIQWLFCRHHCLELIEIHLIVSIDIRLQIESK